MRKSKKIVSGMLAATMVAGMVMGTTCAYARSSMRAAWNDASSSKTTGSQVKDACFVEDGHESEEKTVYSNVYTRIFYNNCVVYDIYQYVCKCYVHYY